VKVLLDHLALVTASEQEILIAVVGIDVHDVPEDRLAADLDHRFRTYKSFFG
jgi:hypothetical protein